MDRSLAKGAKIYFAWNWLSEYTGLLAKNFAQYHCYKTTQRQGRKPYNTEPEMLAPFPGVVV